MQDYANSETSDRASNTANKRRQRSSRQIESRNETPLLRSGVVIRRSRVAPRMLHARTRLRHEASIKMIWSCENSWHRLWLNVIIRSCRHYDTRCKRICSYRSLTRVSRKRRYLLMADSPRRRSVRLGFIRRGPNPDQASSRKTHKCYFRAAKISRHEIFCA